MIIAAFLLAGPSDNHVGSSARPSSGAPLPAVTVAAPPSSDSATLSACARVVGTLPLSLGGANVRAAESDPSSPDIVAWGDPAIVLRCGVGKPANLGIGSSADLLQVDAVLFDAQKQAHATVFTVVDRAVYVEVSVPSSYTQPPLGPIATAVASALPKAVCVSADANPASSSLLCTHRA